MKKKILSLVLVAAMTCSLAACGSSNADTGSTDSATTDSAATTEAVKTDSTEAGTAALKIAIVSSPSGVDDGSFNEDNYNGILSFIAENPDCTVNAIKEETGDPEACAQTVLSIVADYDVIVCCGFQFAGISTIAQDNPDVDFILVDTFPSDDDGNTVELDNLYAMCYAEQESAFCAGMAAALETKTDKVAVVNGIAYPSNVDYQYGFECGVKYVNATEGKNVECVELPSYAGTDVLGNDVGGNYVGTFADEATGKVVGQALIEQGVDILFVAAGGSGNGVFTAAKEATDVKVIGCDVDQYDDGANGDSNIILTSAIKNMHLTVYNALCDIAAGTFKGGNVTLHADTEATGYVSEDGRNQLSAETIQKVDTAFALVKDGTIVPAADATVNDITPDDFVVE